MANIMDKKQPQASPLRLCFHRCNCHYAFIFVVPAMYLLGSLLVIVSITCLGPSFVIINSFLPLLVSNHPTTQTMKQRSRSLTTMDNSPGIALESLSPQRAELPRSLNKVQLKRDIEVDFYRPKQLLYLLNND